MRELGDKRLRSHYALFMTLIVNFNNEIEAALQANAAAVGLSAQAYVGQIVLEALKDSATPVKPHKLDSMLGMLAEYGPGPTEEEIDANRADMLRGFPKDIQW